MSLIPYPNVPNAAGVPDVPRLPDANVAPDNVLLQSADLRSLQIQRNWGIYDANGNALGNPNLFTEFQSNLYDTAGVSTSVSTNSLEFSKKMRISEFPVEQGTFANYNKVELPANPIVTLIYGGSESDRSEFLRQIEVATDVTDLYSVVTPEVTYINFSVESYDYERRNERGANLLIVRISLKQIRQVSAQFTSSTGQIRNPKSENAATEVDNGKVQSTQLNDATKKAVTKKYSQLS